jgi:hypothetical protein
MAVRDMQDNLGRAFWGMLKDDHTVDGLKKILNETRLPTV